MPHSGIVNARTIFPKFTLNHSLETIRFQDLFCAPSQGCHLTQSGVGSARQGRKTSDRNGAYPGALCVIFIFCNEIETEIRNLNKKVP